MLLSKYWVLRIVFVMCFLMHTLNGFAEVLELGESEVHGKKDKPGTITFISHSEIDRDILYPKKLELTDEIEKAIKITSIFGV